jgi:Fic family protein
VDRALPEFAESPSGRLVRVGQGRVAYWAFVPHPLPPPLVFDTALVRTLSDADRALGELAGLARTIPNPQLLIGPFIRREGVLSSRIEGTQADMADLYAYEAGQRALAGFKPAPLQSDVREVHNYVRAMEFGLERVQTLPMSLRLIRELLARLLEGVRGEQATPGEFRRSQNWIGAPGCALGEATYVPPPVPEMQQTLDAFEKYLHAIDPYPPLIRLALIHQQFEAIHPFLDGNGRIGRLLISLLLVHWNLLPSSLLSLSAFFERQRQSYYDLLLAVNQREWRQRVTASRASALLLRLVDSLFESPVLTIPRAQRILGVTYRSAQLNVEKLVQVGILRATDNGRYGRSFVAQDVLRISQESEA